jgi:hypothetical protein
MAANDLRRRIERQLALGVHPATRAPLTPLERFAYAALLAGAPAAVAQLHHLAGLSPAGEQHPPADPTATTVADVAAALALQPGADQPTDLPAFYSSFGAGVSAVGAAVPGAHTLPITHRLPE